MFKSWSYWEENQAFSEASTATHLYEKGVDEQLICEKTGHRSVAVRGYKCTSSNQLKDLSNVLYSNIDETNVKKSKVSQQQL